MQEIWKDIVGYEGIYQISNKGDVKRLEGYRCKKEHLINPCIASNGYKVVTLRHNKKHKLSYLHRLIAIHFIPNPENKPQVNHKDLNKLNNNISNLEWCTFEENMRHAFKNKTWVRNSMIGNQNHKSKPVEQFSLNGIKLNEFESINIASKKTNTNSLHISKCCKGERNTANNFIWKFINKN